MLDKNLSIRPSAARGHVKLDGLDSRHSFSFGAYFDPKFMGFGHLRVINDDWIGAASGFATHPHRDMEIISYAVEGGLAHKDSAGHHDTVQAGEIQFMSAGRGVYHSEMNASDASPARFLQIWIEPAKRGGEPRYAKRRFGPSEGLTLLVSPEGRAGSLKIGQDVDLYRARLSGGGRARLTLRRPRAWVQVVRGALEVNGASLDEGDGLAVTNIHALDFSAGSEAEALIFDLL